MTAALQGRRNGDKARAKRDLANAYHAGAFAGAAFNGKLRPLREYLAEAEGKQGQSAAAIHFFHTLSARGVPIRIERTEMN